MESFVLWLSIVGVVELIGATIFTLLFLIKVMILLSRKECEEGFKQEILGAFGIMLLWLATGVTHYFALTLT